MRGVNLLAKQVASSGAEGMPYVWWVLFGLNNDAARQSGRERHVVSTTPVPITADKNEEDNRIWFQMSHVQQGKDDGENLSRAQNTVAWNDGDYPKRHSRQM